MKRKNLAKKLTALMMTGAMVMSMGMTAFAVEDGENIADTTEATAEITKIINKPENVLTPNTSFQFSINYVGETTGVPETDIDTYRVSRAVAFEYDNDTITPTEDEKKDVTDSLIYSEKLPLEVLIENFTIPGVYRYEVKEIKPEDLVINVDKTASKAVVRVIGAKPTSLLTDALEAELDVKDGVIQPRTEDDILRIACVERYGKGGSIGKSFIKGFGISKGAIATSVGHDHHNITVVGSDAADMAAAVNRIHELNGGIVIAEDGKIKYELPLPICGLLTDLSGEESAVMLKKMQEDLHSKGCLMESPYMTLAFITLIFIPFYGITDKGLVDVINGKVIDPVISCK